MGVTLNAYLAFPGTARQAMEFYHSIFGGDLNMQTYEQTGQGKSENEKDLIIHSELKTPYFVFMGTDGDVKHPIKAGNNFRMCLSGDEEQILHDYFNLLSEEGTIIEPLAKQFWGDVYGEVTDKFGIHWMVNIHKGS